MLRACHEVLRPGGRIAGYTIHTPTGLSRDDAKRASELGPSEVLADSAPCDLLRAAGFKVLLEEDVTADFKSTCEAMLGARHQLEDELRAEEGDALFEEEQQKKLHMIEGVSRGLLRRSLHVASKP